MIALESGGVHSAAIAALVAAGLGADQQSAPVTQWGPRLLLTAAMLLLIALGLWGMRTGWRHRAARQVDVPEPDALPAAVAADLAAAPGVAGLYVATTTADDLLDRIVVHHLGNRGRAELRVAPAGALFTRTGEPDLWIPVESVRAVRLGSGQAQKAFEAGGLILVRWALGPREVETGFRADDPDEHVAAVATLAALVRIPGGAR